MDKESVTIKVKKIDGKAQFQFAKGDDNEGQEITKTVTGVKGYLVQVRIDADSVMRKFEYRLTVSK